MPAAPAPSRPLRDWFSSPVGWITVPLATFTLAFIAMVGDEWRRNPDLSHGLFAPVVFGLLLWEGARRGTQRWLTRSRWITAGAVALVLVGLALFAAAGLLAATVGWAHALVNCVLALALVAAWLGAWLVLADERVRVLPFNWMIFTAIVLWVLASPIPDGTYRRVTMTLQHGVTTGVLDALHMLGIPARQMGNVIELATTSVGVEEACSGIRSLISCLYAGFFFAAWLVRGAGRRLFLILSAPVLAIVMNFIRSLALTLLANNGVDIAGFWHDTTGYAILGVTSLALAGLAALMSAPPPPPAPVAEAGQLAAAPRLPFALLTGVCAIAVALGVFFISFSRSTPASSSAPQISANSLIPESAAGWEVQTSDDLYRFSDILRTRDLAERTYLRRGPNGIVQVTLYVAHWLPGEASVSMVASHTPDACWPGGGWNIGPVAAPQEQLVVGDRRLPAAEHRFFVKGPLPQHVWFWHVYNERPINYRDPYSVPALFEIAWRYGFRREGGQYFIRFSSNQPWENLTQEPLVQEIFRRLATVGLTP